MRMATLALAILGLLFVGTSVIAAQAQIPRAPAAANVTLAANDVVVTPVRWYAYRPAPRWNGYYRYVPYQTYRPRSYWYAPRYYDYGVAVPYRSYYYPPYGYGFEYYGPRRSFYFGY
jgi:hypothetical protein